MAVPFYLMIFQPLRHMRGNQNQEAAIQKPEVQDDDLYSFEKKVEFFQMQRFSF
jgi:hypothetical protein